MGSKPGFFTGPDGAERDQQLLDLVADGNYSFTQIAQKMGAGSRNVVLCRFNRLRKKLGRQHVHVAQPRAGHFNHGAGPPKKVGDPGRLAQINKPKAPLKVIPLVAACDIVPVILEDGSQITELTVGGNMCRFPIGDLHQGDYHYCGHPKKEGSSYCEGHHGVCYVKPEKRVNHLGKKRA